MINPLAEFRMLNDKIDELEKKLTTAREALESAIYNREYEPSGKCDPCNNNKAIFNELKSVLKSIDDSVPSSPSQAQEESE